MLGPRSSGKGRRRGPDSKRCRASLPALPVWLGLDAALLFEYEPFSKGYIVRDSTFKPAFLNYFISIK